MRWLIAVVLLLAFASDGRADVVPPAECPHTVPTNGTSCAPGGPAACTYTVSGVRRICSCRTGQWACENLPSAPHS